SGVSIGSPVTFCPNADWLSPDLFTSKAVDNRAGCAVLMELARCVSQERRDFQVVFVWTAQEEIGARGARVAAANVQPTLAIVVDTVPAGDPATPVKRVPTSVGSGPAIRSLDIRAGRGTVYNAQ